MTKKPVGLQREAPTWAACALVALATSGIAVFATLSLGGHNATRLVRMSGVEPMAELAKETDPGFEFVPSDGHYDGVYFYTIARDPLATGEEHDRIDLAAYRYEHGGYGLLAGLLSFGVDRLIPISLLVINLVSAAGAAVVASLIARRFGLSEWGGLVVALNPGVIYSATADTSEPLGLFLLGLLFLAWMNRRWAWVGILAAALCLTKETFLIVPAGLVAWEAILYLRGHRNRTLVKRFVAAGMGPVVLGLWIVYLKTRFGVWPFTESPDGIFMFPLSGWADSFQIAAGQGLSTADSSQLGQASVVLLAIVGAAIVIGCFRAAKLRSFVDVIYLLTALTLACLGPLGVVFPKDLFRLSSVALVLLGAVLLGYRSDPDGDTAPPARAPGVAGA